MSEQYKLGSLFDGSGGFPLAGTLCGLSPVWASEIELFPIAVTTKRFPNMKHLGDITKINGAEIEPVDVITFGSPCQDLSVAGKRIGLDGSRSGLFMEAIRIIKEMRLKSNGIYPTFAIWENVPGAFSSNKGEDFQTVLEEISHIADDSVSIPRPPKNKWLNAGEILGDTFSVAWRVLDAQYWGVPQRRRRIYLVADFRGQRAREILFEQNGLSRDIKESRASGESTARTTESSTFTPKLLTIRSGCEGGGKGALVSDNKSLALTTVNNQTLFVSYEVCFEQRAYDEYAHSTISATLKATGGTYHGGSETLVLPKKTMVRRLTPLECCRLQGFPDWWCSDIPHSDTAEYKMWGNGVAFPTTLFVVQGIAEALQRGVKNENRTTCR